MDAVNEQRELYLDAICGLQPPAEELAELQKQGFGEVHPGNVWVWNRERLSTFGPAFLRRIYLGLKAEPLPT